MYLSLPQHTHTRVRARACTDRVVLLCFIQQFCVFNFHLYCFNSNSNKIQLRKFKGL